MYYYQAPAGGRPISNLPVFSERPSRQRARHTPGAIQRALTPRHPEGRDPRAGRARSEVQPSRRGRR